MLERHAARRVGAPVRAVAAHDTASAFAAAPLASAHDAVLSSGTWSLLGVELRRARARPRRRGVQPDQRARRGRHRPPAAQRDGPVARPGVPPGVARRGRRARLRRAGGAGRRGPRRRPRCSTPTTTRCCTAATCPPGSPRCAPAPASPPPTARASWCARSSSRSPASTASCSSSSSRSPTAGSTPSTSSAAAPATSCCAGSPPTSARARSSPGRSRPPPWATSWSRPSRLGEISDLAELRRVVERSVAPRRYEPRPSSPAAETYPRFLETTGLGAPV